MTEQQVRDDMVFLTHTMERRLEKYRRNFNRYCNNGKRTEDVREQYGNPISFSAAAWGEDTGVIPNLNVIKSAIDTHISKLSQTKVRPFFNPLVGTFRTRKVCRNAQVYFDEFYELEGVYRKAIDAARFADIFECGCVWIDDESRKVYRIAPWEYFFDPAEFNFGNLTRCLLVQKQFPLVYLKDKLKKGTPPALLLGEHPATKVERAIYYDLIDKNKYTFANADLIETVPIDYDCAPVAMIYLEQPIRGASSASMADDLYTIQQQVDTLCHRIHLALELSPANTIWVPEGSQVKRSMISNEIGASYDYRPLPGQGGTPVIVSTPAPIDPSYLTHLEFWLRQAYESKGISQLSAQAKKPSGLNSGVALQTVEDVESERHNLMLQNYINFLMEIARVCIEVFPEGQDILPKKRGRAAIKWSEIKRERESFSIQFSASSSLSKDPMTKMEQIEKLIGMGIIDGALAASLLEFPDLESAYSIKSSSYDYCQRIIERAVEDGVFDFYEVVNIQQLFGEIANTLLRLDANEEKPEILERLVKLLLIVKEKMDTVNAELAPPPPPQEPPADLPPGPPAPSPPPSTAAEASLMPTGEPVLPPEAPVGMPV